MKTIDRNFKSLSMTLPVMSWFLFFLLIPLTFVIVCSFMSRGPYGGIEFTFTLDNYWRVAELVYLKIFLNSFFLAIITTFSCLVLGYPTAFMIASMKKKYRHLFLILIMIPFLTNFIIRTYAYKNLLGIEGPVVGLLKFLNFTDSNTPLVNNIFAVWFGMVTNYLPFMILPLYVAIDKFDFTMLEAAWDLGASKLISFIKILVPQTMHGIKAGIVLVFIPAFGEFVIPDMLGGAKTMLMGNLIAEQFLKSRDWPFGSALAIILILVTSISLLIEKKKKMVIT